MLKRLSVLVLLVLTPFSAFGEAEPGDYLFLHSKLVGCGDKTFFVDYTVVPDNGTATFLDKYDVDAVGLTADEIAHLLSRKVGEDTGQTPRTISILILPASDVQDIAEDLDDLVLPLPRCSRPYTPDPPDPSLDRVRGLASYTRELSNRQASLG